MVPVGSRRASVSHRDILTLHTRRQRGTEPQRHAHNGTIEGRTAGHVPVFNVSLPLLRRFFPERPFHIIDIAIGDEG